MAYLGTRYGNDMHISDVAQDKLVPAGELSYGTLIAYQVTLCFTKLSVCALYLRVFTTGQASRRILWAATVSIVSFVSCSSSRGYNRPRYLTCEEFGCGVHMHVSMSALRKRVESIHQSEVYQLDTSVLRLVRLQYCR